MGRIWNAKLTALRMLLMRQTSDHWTVREASRKKALELESQVATVRPCCSWNLNSLGNRALLCKGLKGKLLEAKGQISTLKLKDYSLGHVFRFQSIYYCGSGVYWLRLYKLLPSYALLL